VSWLVLMHPLDASGVCVDPMVHPLDQSAAQHALVHPLDASVACVDPSPGCEYFLWWAHLDKIIKSGFS
jgi:hypothetical protein